MPDLTSLIAEAMRDLQRRLMHIPVMHGVDQGDVDFLSEAAAYIERQAAALVLKDERIGVLEGLILRCTDPCDATPEDADLIDGIARALTDGSDAGGAAHE